jgi:hypothetical protein
MPLAKKRPRRSEAKFGCGREGSLRRNGIRGRRVRFRAQTSISFPPKCLAIRHRLLTEFFPPIESARQKFERPQLPSLVRLRLGLLGLTALEPNINCSNAKTTFGSRPLPQPHQSGEQAILIFLLGCGLLLLL